MATVPCDNFVDALVEVVKTKVSVVTPDQKQNLLDALARMTKAIENILE